MSIEINASAPVADKSAASQEPIPLDPGAAALLAVLAGQDGAAVEAAVVAALAGVPTVAAVRHLRQLVRVGLVSRHAAGGYSCDPETARARGVVASIPDESAWTRVTSWYLASLFAAAQVVGAAALPEGERIEPDPDRWPVSFSHAQEAVDWFAAVRPDLIEVLSAAVQDGDVEQGWRLAVLILNVACVTGGGHWQQVAELGRRAAQHAGSEGGLGMVLEYQGLSLLSCRVS